jgi:hypothetical protein
MTEHLTVHEMAEKVGISYGSSQTILTEDLEIRHVSNMFIPQLPTQE